MDDPFQSNLAFLSLSTSFSGFSQLPEEKPLWCLIQGDRQAFKVAPPLYIDVDDLKRVIHAGIDSRVPPKDLILWKVWGRRPNDHNIVINHFSIAERIRTIGTRRHLCPPH